MKKKMLMVDDYMLNKVLDQIREIIGLEKFDGTKILIDTVNKLPDDSCYWWLVLLKMAINVTGN